MSDPTTPEVTASPGEGSPTAPAPLGDTTPPAPTLTATAPSTPPAPAASSTPAAPPAQTSMAAPAPAPRGLSYAVDITFCVDVTGSMTPILDQVKANALGFYDDVQANLTEKGKNVDQLRVRVIAFRDFKADGDAAMQESPFFALPASQADFSAFVNGLIAEGGGDAPESGLEAVALAINSPWTTTGDRRRQVIVVWTDQPAQPLDPSVLPGELASRVPVDFSALTDLWENEQGPMGSSAKRLILFAPDGPGWSDISGVWENVGAPPLAGRCGAVRCRLRDDHRLDRQLGVSGTHAAGAGGRSRRLRADGVLRLQPGQGAGQGEDSDPILRHGPNLGLLAVFDGMGGAGGTVYDTPDGRRTGAYLASRVAQRRRRAAACSTCWSRTGTSMASRRPRTCDAPCRQALVERLAELKAPPSGLRSRLLRALPTTMALAALQRTDPGGRAWSCHLLWAGDSRAYLFEPGGAHQLTTDDIRDAGDAMANLREDSVVSNAISADTEFRVNHRHVRLRAPFLAICATDGCFGYVSTPMHFERLVLGALIGARSATEWSAQVQSDIAAVAGDDAAMCVLAVGAGFDELQELFAPRLAELEEQYTGPLDELTARVQSAQQQLEAARQEYAAVSAERWRRYKAPYERYLQDPTALSQADAAQSGHPAEGPPGATGATTETEAGDDTGPQNEEQP